jgi:hypothetical protein
MLVLSENVVAVGETFRLCFFTLQDWTAGVPFPAGTRDFSVLCSVQIGSEAHPAYYAVGKAAGS